MDENRKESEERNDRSRGSRERNRPVMPGQKKKVNIINPDALKSNEDNQPEPEPKVSLSSKPNLFKGKREGNKLLIPNRESTHLETASQNHGEAPKPTPQVPRKRGNFDFRNRDRENVVIQDD